MTEVIVTFELESMLTRGDLPTVIALVAEAMGKAQGQLGPTGHHIYLAGVEVRT